MGIYRDRVVATPAAVAWGTPSPRLVTRWAMTDGGGSQLTDSEGVASLALAGTASANFWATPGKINCQVAASDYAQTQLLSVPSALQLFKYSFPWIVHIHYNFSANPAASARLIQFTGIDASSSFYGLYLYQNAGNLYLTGTNAGGSVNMAGAISAGTDHHALFAFDPSSQSLMGYFDAGYAGSITPSLSVSISKLEIAIGANYGGSNPVAQGTSDNMLLWDAEVYANPNASALNITQPEMRMICQYLKNNPGVFIPPELF